MIHVQCKCGGSFQVRDEFSGKRGRCPRCSTLLFIGQANIPPVLLPRIGRTQIGPIRNEATRCSQCGSLSEIATFTCSYCGASLAKPKADEVLSVTLFESQPRSLFDGIGKVAEMFDGPRIFRKEALQLPETPEELVSHFAKHVGGVPDLAYGDIHFQACEAVLTKLRVFSFNNLRLSGIVSELQNQLDAKPRQWEILYWRLGLALIPIVLMGVIAGLIALACFVFGK